LDFDDCVNRINSGADIHPVSPEWLAKIWESWLAHTQSAAEEVDNRLFGGLVASFVDHSRPADEVLAVWIRSLALKVVMSDAEFVAESPVIAIDQLLTIVATVEMNGTELIPFDPIRQRILARLKFPA
jgi:hypothetical protein